mgnify:CR=1 FL=1
MKKLKHIQISEPVWEQLKVFCSQEGYSIKGYVEKLIKNKSICVLPYTGFIVEPTGRVKNCIMSKDSLGNINDTFIKEKMGRNKKKKLKMGWNLYVYILVT